MTTHDMMERAVYSAKQPYVATFIGAEPLCQAGSGKEVFHVRFAIPAHELPCEAGDALCVIPENAVKLVTAVLRALHYTGDEQVCTAAGVACSVREALTAHCCVSHMKHKFLVAWAQVCADASLQDIAADKERSLAYREGRDLLDVVTEYAVTEPHVLEAQACIDLLSAINPRLYSVASSQKSIDNEIELCVGLVEWEQRKRRRHGVCSYFLACNAAAGDRVRVYIHRQKRFKLPVDVQTDIIMIGPGTGIAPFRGFMQERALAAGGRNWLYFGDWTRQKHFYYAAEWRAYQDAGVLHNLDLAFSRDQEQKIYVQTLLKKNAAETWAWIDGGAHVYVCGDAKRMAHDVERVLLEIIADEGAMSADDAVAYLKVMKKELRYQRDVY